MILCLCAVVAPAIAQGNGRTREQTRFGLEEPVKRPARIPADVLRLLGRDERVQARLADESTRPLQVPARWFAASVIQLNNDRLPDLVVKAEDAGLFGANIGPFWVFRNTGRGYALALRVDTLGLEVLPGRTRGYRNIRTQAASARQVFTRNFAFNGRSYREVRR